MTGGGREPDKRVDRCLPPTKVFAQFAGSAGSLWWVFKWLVLYRYMSQMKRCHSIPLLWFLRSKCWCWVNLLSPIWRERGYSLMQRLSWGRSLKSYLFLHRRPIPRSWQFGANLGGEGQKLPQNCRLGGGGRCENDPPFFAQVAADARTEVSKSVQAKDLWSVGTLASWNFTFCVLSDCNPTLSPLSPDVWLFIPAREMAISIPMAACGAQEVTLGPAAWCHPLSLLLPSTHSFYIVVFLSYL